MVSVTAFYPARAANIWSVRPPTALSVGSSFLLATCATGLNMGSFVDHLENSLFRCEGQLYVIRTFTHQRKIL